MGSVAFTDTQKGRKLFSVLF